MDLTITGKKEEPLLSRTEINSELNFDSATPSRKEVKSKIASLLNADQNLIAIRSIYTNFGLKKASVTAYVYNDKKEMENIEIKPKDKNAAEKEKSQEKGPEAKDKK